MGEAGESGARSGLGRGRVRPDRFPTNNKFGQAPTNGNGNGKAREEK